MVSFRLFWRGAFVDKIDNRLVWNTAVVCQTNLASARVGISVFDSGLLELRTELAQTPGIEFGMREALVTGKAAASNFGRDENVGRA